MYSWYNACRITVIVTVFIFALYLTTVLLSLRLQVSPSARAAYSVITRVMSSSGAAAGIDELYLQREIVQAFDNVKVIDCLDLSPEGMATWDASMKR